MKCDFFHGASVVQLNLARAGQGDDHLLQLAMRVGAAHCAGLHVQQAIHPFDVERDVIGRLNRNQEAACVASSWKSDPLHVHQES